MSLPNPPPLPPLPSPLAPLIASLNHLLAQEPWASQALRLHVGKIVCIVALPFELRLQVTPDGMVAAADADAASSVTIRVRLADLPLIAQNRERAFSYVKLEGDAEFANAISQLSKSLRWEAEHDLEKVLGPIAASRLVEGAKAAVETARSGQRKLAENVAEYLLDEQPVLVRPVMAEEFGAGVSRLRDDVERAAKRLANLEKKLAQRASPRLDPNQ
ncbi:MAG: SCP2 sterol-binding domain-containing protein [Pseudomonadota bacterium]